MKMNKKQKNRNYRIRKKESIKYVYKLINKKGTTNQKQNKNGCSNKQKYI